MSRVLIADTSFLYALFSSTDHFHDKARRAAEKGAPIAVPPEIFSETLALIQYRQGFDRAKAAGAWIRDQGHIEVGLGSPAIRDKSWRIFGVGKGRLSYPDAVVLAWCEAHAAEPLAFDESIVSRARR